MSTVGQTRARSRLVRLAASVAALALVGAACGGDSSGGTAGGEEEFSGTINVSGSSTVAPITTRVAEFFEGVQPDVTVNVDGLGTGDGFKLFCNGEADISDASRPIKHEEADACADKGIEFIELKVALDGMAVVTNPDNDQVECLNFVDLYALTGPENAGTKNWRDAQQLASELGSKTTFPDAPLSISAPGEESGTYDSFVELVIEGFASARGKESVTRPDYQSSPDDNVILQGIAGVRTSLGWVGLSYVEESGGLVKAVPVAADPGSECVEPTTESVQSGAYPLARPLYIYVNATKVTESPALGAFVDYYLSDEGLDAVPEVQYVPLADQDIEATRGVWAAKQTGSRDGG